MAAWLLLCGFCGDLPAAANARYSVDHWKAQPGMLPQGSVITMLQTRDGYLWLGTLNGLVRFDGIRFTVFDESNTEGLNTSRIVYLFEDSRKNLWVGTEMAGVVLIKDGQIKSLDIGRGSREGRLVAACEDANGAVWLYTADGHLCRYWEGKIDVWNAGTDSFSGCRALIAEQGGPLWLGTDRGLFGIGPNASLSPIVLPVEQVVPINGKLDFLLASSRGGHWRFVDGHVQKWTASRLERDLGPYPWKTSTTISAACEDQDGNPVVGTLGQGLFRFDTQGKATCISTNEGLSNNYILSLHMDHEGSLWVGTDGGGLNRLKRQVFNLLDESAGLTVQSICEDAQGGLWFSSQGRGVDYWQGGELKQFGTLEGPMNALNLRTMFIDHNQKVWAATFGGGLFQLDNGLFRPATAAEPINKEISAIYEDHAGQIWIGTQTGLACWDGHNWKAFAAADKSSAIAVRALAGDAAGNLWIGTVGAGLSRLKDGQFKEYHKSDGLPSENISSLYVDDDDVLWDWNFWQRSGPF
jgi:ligand-binding sensor domain-containing protein